MHDRDLTYMRWTKRNAPICDRYPTKVARFERFGSRFVANFMFPVSLYLRQPE